MNKVKLFLMVGLFSLAPSSAYTQDRPAHELHSMMIYNFLKYIEWPGDKNSGDFLVGVIGADDVYNTLNTWYGNKTRGNKNFIIKKALATDDLSGYQLVYIGKLRPEEFEVILNRVSSKPILTITAKKGFGKKGSCINFKVVDNRLKFELNETAIQKTTLKTSSQLAAMAIII
ncbi:MAG: YfiR family protein [Bacteroidota bacterium]